MTDMYHATGPWIRILFDSFDIYIPEFDKVDQDLENISGLADSDNDLIEFSRKLAMNDHSPIDVRAFIALAIGLRLRLRLSPELILELRSCCFCRCSNCNVIKLSNNFYTSKETVSFVCNICRRNVSYISPLPIVRG